MELQRVGVIGAGQMGNGIAQVCAAKGLEVVLCDVAEDALEAGMVTIGKSLDRFVEKGKLSTQERDETLGRIRPSTAVDTVSDTDLVVEAATEDEALKASIFRDLDEACGPDTLLASNTSSISITRIAAVTRRPGKVIGMHFMNPVPIMKLVEIIRALQTDDATYAAVDSLARRLGKEPVTVQDAFGFVSNRILLPMINEAVFTLYEGLATAEDIDTVMKLGMNHPMGPLALADLIGLDTCLHIMEVLYDGFNDSKYRPCPLLKQMVDAGYLGRKSGRGFHSYQ